MLNDNKLVQYAYISAIGLPEPEIMLNLVFKEPFARHTIKEIGYCRFKIQVMGQIFGMHELSQKCQAHLFYRIAQYFLDFGAHSFHDRFPDIHNEIIVIAYMKDI